MNEDGLLVWQISSWEFATLIDAHASFDSAELIIATIVENENAIKEILDSKIDVSEKRTFCGCFVQCK